jgi:hypothetical protein
MDGNGSRKLELASIKLRSADPYTKTVEESKLDLDASRDNCKFEVSCHAGTAGHLDVVSKSVSLRIGQRVRSEGKEAFWGGLLVECKERDDGSLAVEVVVYHPEWDEPMRVASIQSYPFGGNAGEPAVQCDLEHKRL